MHKRFTIEEAERRCPDMVKGQKWMTTQANYLFRCTKPNSGHPNYPQNYNNHQRGSGCPACRNERLGEWAREKSIKGIVGTKYGSWTVRKVLDERGLRNRTLVSVECECGEITILHLNALKEGRTTRCKKCWLSALHSANRLRPCESLFNMIRLGAEARGLSCILTYEEFFAFTQENRCHYCHAPVDWTPYNLRLGSHRYNLDRIDNSRGYENDNLVVCCTRCNKARGRRYTYEEWLGMNAYFRNLVVTGTSEVTAAT